MQKEKKTSDVFKRVFSAINNSYVYITDTTKHFRDSFWYRRGSDQHLCQVLMLGGRVGRTVCIDDSRKRCAVFKHKGEKGENSTKG